MKSLLIPIMAAGMVSSAMAQVVDHDANILPIFGGGGNPIGDWNEVTDSGVEVALRAKERFVVPVMNHVDNVYYIPTGTAPINRSDYNIEVSVHVVSGVIADVDVYLKIDTDPSVGINFATVNVLTYWADNAYGDPSIVVNGGGFDGTAAQYAGTYNIVQLSQNLGFAQIAALGVTSPAAPSTRDFVLYAVPAGAGPDAEPLSSVSIQVVQGVGGKTVEQLIADIDTSGMNHGEYVNAVKAIANYLFSGGVINNKERAGLISTAAKSSVGK